MGLGSDTLVMNRVLGCWERVQLLVRLCAARLLERVAPSSLPGLATAWAVMAALVEIALEEEGAPSSSLLGPPSPLVVMAPLVGMASSGWLMASSAWLEKQWNEMAMCC